MPNIGPLGDPNNPNALWDEWQRYKQEIERQYPGGLINPRPHEFQHVQSQRPANPTPRHPIELVIEEIQRVQPHIDQLMSAIEQGEKKLEEQRGQLQKLSEGMDQLKQFLAEQMENADPELREKASKELFK